MMQVSMNGLYSDDGTLYGTLQNECLSYSCCTGGSYSARIWRTDNNQLVCLKSFGNGVDAENWMLDKLECPLFTILQQ